jgi:hypothetical protein
MDPKVLQKQALNAHMYMSISWVGNLNKNNGLMSAATLEDRSRMKRLLSRHKRIESRLDRKSLAAIALDRRASCLVRSTENSARGVRRGGERPAAPPPEVQTTSFEARSTQHLVRPSSGLIEALSTPGAELDSGTPYLVRSTFYGA